jgi:hypothetical protein
MAAPRAVCRRASWPNHRAPAPLHLSLMRWFISVIHKRSLPLEIHAAARVVRQGRARDLQDDVADPILPIHLVANRRTRAEPIPKEIPALVGEQFDMAGIADGRVVLKIEPQPPLSRCRIAKEDPAKRVADTRRPRLLSQPIMLLDPVKVAVPHRLQSFAVDGRFP